MTGKIRIPVSEYKALRDARDKSWGESGRIVDERRKVLNQVLVAFGLQESYPDVEKARKELARFAMPPWTPITPNLGPRDLVEVPYTELGVDKFARDLEEAASAAAGESALKSIRKAIKEAIK